MEYRLIPQQATPTLELQTQRSRRNELADQFLVVNMAS